MTTLTVPFLWVVSFFTRQEKQMKDSIRPTFAFIATMVIASLFLWGYIVYFLYGVDCSNFYELDLPLIVVDHFVDECDYRG